WLHGGPDLGRDLLDVAHGSILPRGGHDVPALPARELEIDLARGVAVRRVGLEDVRLHRRVRARALARDELARERRVRVEQDDEAGLRQAELAVFHLEQPLEEAVALGP